MNKKVVFAVLSIDGLCSLETGVGVVVESFIDGFSRFVNTIQQSHPEQYALYCFSPHLSEQAVGYRADIASKTKHCCQLHQGEYRQFPTLASGQKWGSLWFGKQIATAHQQWQEASKQACHAIETLDPQYDHIYVLAHDTVFAGVARFFGVSSKVTVIWIPHSLGVIFDDDFMQSKLNYEHQAIQFIVEYQHRIGYVSEYVKDILQSEYDIPNNGLIPLLNGLNNNAPRHQPSVQAGLKFLQENKIDPQSHIIFSWGRCKEQKGFDLLIPAIKNFIKQQPDLRVHVILIMPTATTAESYLQQIKELTRTLPAESITLRFEFDEKLPVNLLASGCINTVVLASRFEAVGLVALEALEYAVTGTNIVYSPIPPFQAIFKEQAGCIECSQLSEKGLLRALNESVGSTINTIDRHRPVGLLVDNYVAGLRSLFEADAC